MLTIPVGKTQVALIDDTDYELVRYHIWYPHKSRFNANTVYAKNGYLMMHLLILPPKTGFNVDHADMNGLNNQRYNLRYATYAQQSANRPPMGNNAFGYKGVKFDATCKLTPTYRARIRYNKTQIQLGRFDTAEEAALAYDIAAHELYGNFAYLNFKIKVPTVD